MPSCTRPIPTSRYVQNKATINGYIDGQSLMYDLDLEVDQIKINMNRHAEYRLQVTVPHTPLDRHTQDRIPYLDHESGQYKFNYRSMQVKR